MSSKLNLDNRRIFLTEVPEGIGNDLCRSLISKKAIVIAIGKNPDQIKEFELNYPTLIPILLDFSKCPVANMNIVGKLPYFDHIVNFSGPVFDSVSKCILKHYRPESADIRTTKVDDVVSKLVLAGSRNTIVNFSDTISEKTSNCSGSSASLAATQFTDALRTSFRKLFRGKSLQTDNQSQPKSETNSHELAKRSSTVPLNSVLQFPGSKPNTSSANGTSTANSNGDPNVSSRRKLSLRLLLKKSNSGTITGSGGISGAQLKSEDEKLKKSMTKLHKEFRKVWERKLKKLKLKESRKLGDINREVNKFKRQVISSINEKNVPLNAATLSRSNALSPELANKIVESRERKVDKEASQLAQKKFVEEKAALETQMSTAQAAAAEKHYHKIVKRQLEVLDKRAAGRSQNRRQNVPVLQS